MDDHHFPRLLERLSASDFGTRLTDRPGTDLLLEILEDPPNANAA